MKTKLEYYFFSDSPEYKTKDIELQMMLDGDVDIKTYSREERPELFKAEIGFFAPEQDQHPVFRQPVPANSSDENRTRLTRIRQYIEDYHFVYVLTNIKDEPADTGYWDAFYDLLNDMLQELDGGIFIDATSTIVYAAGYVQMYWKEYYSVREFVALKETGKGSAVDIQTVGMNKFSGQRDLVIRDFPKEYVEMGRRLLYDNLCSYVMKSGKTLEAGQNMQYKRDDDAAKWFFSEDDGSLLLVTDAHPSKKEKIDGLGKYLSIVAPMWDNQYKAEYEAWFKKDEPKPAEDQVGTINTLEEFADFMILLERGQVDTALQKYGLTYETMGDVTSSWTEMLSDTDSGVKFGLLMEDLRKS